MAQYDDGIEVRLLRIYALGEAKDPGGKAMDVGDEAEDIGDEAKT